MATHYSGNVTWVDYPATTTPVTKATLENIENAIDKAPRGAIARFFSASPAGAATTTTNQAAATKAAELSASVVAGRLYRIEAQCGLGGSANVEGVTQLNYTVDGTTPTAASPRLRWQVVLCGGSTPTDSSVIGHYVPSASATLKLALSYCSLVGASVYLDAEAGRPIELVICDEGVDPGATGTRF